MPRISSAQAGGSNVCAFLDAIAVSEIGSALLLATDDGYNVIVGSTPSKPLLFDSYATHPDVYNRKLNSTAAGRYQFLYRYWPHYRAQLKLPDFGSVSQDLWAIQYIRECRALDDVRAGRFGDAISKCKGRWASLPNSGYGQHENSVAELTDAYRQAGGQLA